MVLRNSDSAALLPRATAALLLLLACIQVAPINSDVAPPLTMGEPEVLAAGEATLVRERRGDSYGGYGGGGYGGGGGGYGGGSYGCSCPYVSCDYNNNNGILAFGVGALLGLLLAMLRAMAVAPAPAPAPGRSFGAGGGLEDHLRNVTWSDAAHGPPPHKSSLLELLHLPDGFGDNVGPMMSDLLHIYTRGSKHPECMRRWVCEATRQAQNKGGVAARLGSLSSIAYAWYTKDLSAILQNILPGTKDVDCKYLSPKCDLPFTEN